MLSSSFGKNLKITISGGSHEPEMSVDICGLPAGIKIDMDALQSFLNRRAPGNSKESTSRKEADKVLLKEGTQCKEVATVTTDNKPLTFVIKNENYNSKAYNLSMPRPGHADLPAYLKYGKSVNMAGGGPFSGRMTAMLCVAGGIALQILESMNIKIGSQVLSIGQIRNRAVDSVLPEAMPISEAMKQEIQFAKESKNSVGGVAEVFATGVPLGLGGCMYDGVESVLSPIFFGIPGVKGVEFGNGFAASYLMGSENNDDFIAIGEDKKIATATNNHGGILGGLTTGMPLIARIGFKPTPSIGKPQQTINLNTGKAETIATDGRHDPCIVPRALPVAEAAMAVGLLDMMLNKDFKNNSLKDMREEIDNIDNQLILLLKRRMSLAEDVAKYKMDNNLPIEHTSREEDILKKAGANFNDIYKEIFRESKRIQQDIFQNGRKESDEK